ncbi:hypothetical protein DX130_00100 [Paenibacillus paeoniae]|uniref:Uncharacterized protein n=1 Tax=Paenibacillus paeoniae TaxID=2292705 RepID=A0A371PH22_9BACL|nr:hypothetical protein DX130_00100 [Paenibacillus paeoniae]
MFLLIIRNLRNLVFLLTVAANGEGGDRNVHHQVQRSIPTKPIRKVLTGYLHFFTLRNEAKEETSFYIIEINLIGRRIE